MGYWMRFFDTKKTPLKLNTFRTALRRIDCKYDVETETPLSGHLIYKGEPFAQVEISKPGDGVFNEELADYRANVEAKRGKKDAAAKAKVLATLDKVKHIIAVRVGDHDDDPLELLDTVWDWLFDHRGGLLHAEGEGFYEDETLILALK